MTFNKNEKLQNKLRAVDGKEEIKTENCEA